MDIQSRKQAWRERIAKLKASTSKAELERYNAQIQQQLFVSTHWTDAQHVALYYSIEKEVDTLQIMHQAWQEGKRVYLPKCNPVERSLTFYLVEYEQQLETVYYGIPEPDPNQCQQADENDYNLIIVPGLVFDHRGYRIGYGAGYYDRFLQHIKKKIPLVSLAYPFQLADDELPHDVFDIPVHQIYLPAEIITCKAINVED